MNLIRLIAIAAIIWLIYRMVTGRKRSKERIEQKQGRPVDKMVKCAYCGTHVPESEAIAANGRYYCSEEHRDSDTPA